MLLPLLTSNLEEGTESGTPENVPGRFGFQSLYVSKMVALSFCPQRFLRVAWMGLKAEAPAVARIDELEQYFKTTWLSGSYPLKIWNYHEVEGPRTNNHIEGWHNKINRLAHKSHPNILNSSRASKLLLRSRCNSLDLEEHFYQSTCTGTILPRELCGTNCIGTPAT